MTAKILDIICTIFFTLNSANCCEEPLSAQTISLLHEALEAFNIPKESISLEPAQVCAAEPSQKKIFFTPGPVNEINTFVAYHEAAHLTDPALQKVCNKVNVTRWGGFAMGIGSVIAAGTPALAHSLKAHAIDSSSVVGVSSGIIIFALSYIAGIKMGNYFAYPHQVKAEHFANIKACEKLIQKSNYAPILAVVTTLKILEYCDIDKSSSDHPPAIEEREAIECYLKRHNISIVYDQHPCQPTLQTKLYINNVLHGDYQKHFNPLKICADFKKPWWQNLIE